jgi:hypothetical protein
MEGITTMETTMKKESIISRIKKLLNMTEDRGATTAEAATAAAKAQALLFEHNLEMSECTSMSEPVEDIGNHYNETGVKEGSPYSRSYVTLYNQIARYNFCRLINVGQGKVALVGKKSNVEVATYLYEYLSKALANLADKAYETYKNDAPKSDTFTIYRKVSARSFKVSFIYGAAIEIGVRLKEQLRASEAQSSACTALVVVSDKQLALKVKEFFPRLQSGRRGRIGSNDGYSAGQAAGRSISLSRGVSGSSRAGYIN